MMITNNTGIHQDKVWKVLKTEPENHDITSLYLEGEDERLAKRRAGQWASIRVLREDGWSEPHPFTISCAPGDEILRFTIKKVGAFTSSIPELQPGTAVKVEGPFGVFCRDIEKRSEIAMIAGGIGITPFLSVVRRLRTIRAKNSITLFWSNKTIADLFAVDELKETTRDLDLKIICTISREKEVEKYFQAEYPRFLFLPGHITREVLTGHLRFAGASFYLCGPPRMQESILKELEASGVDPNSVDREQFTYQEEAAS
jgi:predicted ferric reductase